MQQLFRTSFGCFHIVDSHILLGYAYVNLFNMIIGMRKNEMSFVLIRNSNDHDTACFFH